LTACHLSASGAKAHLPGTAAIGAKQPVAIVNAWRWRRPDAAPSTKGWAKGAKSQSEESIDTGATGDPTNDRTQKTGPMCISRRLAHGAGLIVAAFSARDILRCVKLTSDGSRNTAAALACGKPRAYFFIFLVFLATFLVALAVFFAFFAFFAMSSSRGWLA